MSKNMLILSTLSAVLLLSTAEAALSDEPNAMSQFTPEGMERCHGIVKKGMNDCAAAGHNCSGEAKLDNDKKEWLFVPSGLCKRITGGSTSAKG
jgi:uncharacterized membrane protein